MNQRHHFPVIALRRGRTSPVTKCALRTRVPIIPQFLQGAKPALFMVPQTYGDECNALDVTNVRQTTPAVADSANLSRCRPAHAPPGHSSRGPTPVAPVSGQHADMRVNLVEAVPSATVPELHTTPASACGATHGTGQSLPFQAGGQPHPDRCRRRPAPITARTYTPPAYARVPRRGPPTAEGSHAR